MRISVRECLYYIFWNEEICFNGELQYYMEQSSLSNYKGECKLHTFICFNLLPDYGPNVTSCLLIRRPLILTLLNCTFKVRANVHTAFRLLFQPFFFPHYAIKLRKSINKNIVDLWNWFIAGMWRNLSFGIEDWLNG